MITENLCKVRENIVASLQKRRSELSGDSVTLIAVTKNHPAPRAQAAIDAGVTDIGENRVQEAKEKFPSLTGTFTRHLIGHLQTNKAKLAVEYFDLIHSVDSEHLAAAIDSAAAKLGKIQDILIQVNLAEEVQKSGVYAKDLPSLADFVDNLPHLRLCGFMLMAPAYDNVENCRPLFQKMYEIFQRSKEKSWSRANIKYLSMGMSNDYRIAVEEGANMVRVGTAIFGQREY